MLKSFLTNRAINFLNIHSGIQSFANSFGSLFIGVFLYQTGIPLWQIFLAIGTTFATRMLFRPLSLKMCFQYGMKKTLIVGTILYSLNYPVLGQIETIDSWFFLFFFLFALTDVFYWLPYHTIFAVLGDSEHRGKQTSLRDALFSVAGFLAPVVSGILVVTYGYWSAFAAAMVFMLVALIPLARLPKLDLQKLDDVKNPRQALEKDGFWLYLGDGFFYNHDFVWRLVLFLVVLNPVYFGGLIGLAVFLQFILHLFVGHFFDKGKGAVISRIGMLIVVLSVLGRGVLVDSIPEVIFFDVFFAIGMTLYMPIFSAAFYNLSKSSKHPLWFQYYSEMGWDIGAGLASLMTAAIVFVSDDLRLAMMLSLLGLVLTQHVLKKYFQKEQLI